MTVYNFKKLIYSELPEVVQKAVLEFGPNNISIDDASLSAVQKARIREWLADNGYKLHS